MNLHTNNLILCLLASMSFGACSFDQCRTIVFEATTVIRAGDESRAPLGVLSAASTQRCVEAIKPQQSLLTKAIAASKMKPTLVPNSSIRATAVDMDTVQPIASKAIAPALPGSTQPITIPHTESQARMKAEQHEKFLRDNLRKETLTTDKNFCNALKNIAAQRAISINPDGDFRSCLRDLELSKWLPHAIRP